MIIGNATQTMGKEGGLSDMFKQMIYIPLPDYSTRMKLVSHFLTRLGLSQYTMTGVAKDMRILTTLAVSKNEVEISYSAIGLMGL